ncbi:hypothetical protein EV128_13226 [Rhizobium azibense]|nr:hypothetical protein EV128_13226 [Rhizobium azibense]
MLKVETAQTVRHAFSPRLRGEGGGSRMRASPQSCEVATVFYSAACLAIGLFGWVVQLA